MKSLLIAILTLTPILTPFQSQNAQEVANLPSSEALKVYSLSSNTTFTAYSLEEAQTDGNPCIGSGNHNLCELKPLMAEKNIKICASRDFPLHTLIYIDGVGVCEILDRLNKRYEGTNRVDILMDSREEALSFGKQKLNYALIK
jgi:3D (Asp-Asp-Asp) domain-containing protein